jgi:hypothetical protein
MADTKAQIVLSAVDRTRAAFASVDKQLKGIGGVAAGVATRLGTLGGAFAGLAAVASLKGVIDDLDQLGKVAERVGISVESLQGLRFAAELNDVSFDDLEGSAARLAKVIGDAADGGKRSVGIFQALGVEIRDSAGNIRGTDKILADIADRFAGYEDGAKKAQLAQELFGRSGATLLNFLNQGSQGIREASSELEKLGAVYSEDLTRQSAEFNDNLTRLGVLAKAAAASLANTLLPTLNEYIGQLIEGRKQYGSFLAAIADQGLRVDPFKSLRENINAAGDDVRRLEADLGRLDRREGISNSLATDKQLAYRKALLENELKLARARKATLEAQEPKAVVASPEQREQAPAIVDASAAERAARQAAREAERGAGDVASEAERLREAQLAERIRGIQRGLQAEQALYTFQERQLEQVYRAGLTSLDDYYADRARIAEQALAAETQAIDQQVAALRQSQSRQTGGERVQTEQQINDLLAQRVQLEDEAARAAALSDGERNQAAAQLEAELRELQAQVLELGGNDKAAALARLEEGLASVAITVRQAGGDSGLVDELRRLGQAQISLNDIRTQQSRITQEAALVEENYILAAQKRGQGELETERGVVALREQSLQKLRELAAAARELAAANPLSQDIQLQAQELANAVLAAEAVVDPALERIRQRTADVAQIGAEALGTFVQTSDAKGALRQLEQQLLSLLTQILIVEPAARALRDALGGITGGGSSAGGGGGLGGLFSSFLGSILGSADGNAFDRLGHVTAFAKGSAFTNTVVDSPTFFRFGQGGSFASGVMGEAGPEGVLPLKRTAGGDLGVQVAGGGGVTVNAPITISVSGQVDRSTAEQIARRAQRAVESATARGTA